MRFIALDRRLIRMGIPLSLTMVAAGLLTAATAAPDDDWQQARDEDRPAT